MKGGIVVALLIAILLAITNPGTEDFKSYLETKWSQANGTTGDTLGQAVSAFARNLEVQMALANATREDYVVFSRYTVQQGDRTHSWIGVAKQFIPLSD